MEKDKVLAIIANNLKKLMVQSEMSPTELAKKCNISAGSVSKITKGTMGITIPMALNIAEGLGVNLNDLLEGLVVKLPEKEILTLRQPALGELFFIGILSINNKRITCIKSKSGKIIGRSELDGGLDLVRSPRYLLNLIEESIFTACPNNILTRENLKNAKLNLVTQSFEFEDARTNFKFFAEKYFKEAMLFADWQLYYLSTFGNAEGISLITDKGVSLSYMHDKKLKKLGGWKFPVYDLGGENWLGNEAIKHAIEAKEGYIPMTKLAHSVLKSFGKIEKITEICHKSHDADIYCSFAEPLYKNYYMGDEAAKAIILRGFQEVHKLVDRADNIFGKKTKIALGGSLSDLYRPYFDEGRLIPTIGEAEKTSILAVLSEKFSSDIDKEIIS